jgi:hypothetical protein
MVKGVRWFNSVDTCIGIVKVETQYDGIQYFIGACSGQDAEADSRWIADWGGRFPVVAGKVLFND